MPTVVATIAGRKMELNAPYEAGHVLTDVEARVLNQTWVENVRNNVAKKLESGEIDEDDVLAYAASYTFAQRGTRATVEADPVEDEFRAQAMEFIRAVLKQKGKTLRQRVIEWAKERPEFGLDEHGLPSENFRRARAAYIAETIEKIRSVRPDIYESARQAVEARKAARAIEAAVPVI